MLNELTHSAAIRAGGGHVHAGLPDRNVPGCSDLAAQDHHVLAVHDEVGDFFLRIAANSQVCGSAVACAGFGLQTTGGRLLSC